MNSFVIPPFLIMLVGAFTVPFVHKNFRSLFVVLITAITLVVVVLLPDSAVASISLMSFRLDVLYVDRLSRIFGFIFAFITLAGTIYAFHNKNVFEQIAVLLYAGAALGVVFTKDFITLLLCWELMALASTYLVLAGTMPDSHKAAFRYFFVHLFGGTILLAGILLYVHEFKSISITNILTTHHLSSWFILIGVAINAAIPPLHAWLPDAYPKASITGAIFLSALTTKTAVYVLVRLFPGWDILLYAGVAMTLYGVIYAVFANNIREILAYHIVSQVGYMVTGVGIGTEVALNGTTAHAFSHILYKALLFMGAGSVVYATGKTTLTELGGLVRSFKYALLFYMIGAFSISGFPLFNGFISKSMIISAAGYNHLDVVVLLLHLASVGTFLSVGLKLPYYTWYGKEKATILQQLPINMYIGMALLSFSCLLFGVAPNLLYQYLPFDVTYDPFTLPHLLEAVQILTATFIGFWIVRKLLAGSPTISLDTDWFYRKPKKFIIKIFVLSLNTFFTNVELFLQKSTNVIADYSKNPLQLQAYINRPTAKLPAFDPDSNRKSISYIIISILLCFCGIVFIWLLF